MNAQTAAQPNVVSALLPPSSNSDYRGSPAAPLFLGLVALLTLGPALVHSFLPDGGAQSIAGLSLDGAREVVIGVFRWEGATQLALGLVLLAVAVRYRTLTAICLMAVFLETGLSALQAWVLAPPSNGHHPPEHFGAAIMAPLSLAFLWLAARRARA